MCSALVVPTAGQHAYEQLDWPLPATSEAGTAAPWHFGEAAAVATSRQGTILVLRRGAHPILEFDLDGNFVGSWGEGGISSGKVTQVPAPGRTAAGSRYTVVYGPAACFACGAHSVRTDPDGHVWVVDAAAHIVYRTDQHRNVTLQLGERGVPGTDSAHFNLPTDVAFGPNGEIYVSDGYGSARILKFSEDGDYVREWGKRGSGPGEFGLPHNLVVDANGRVYVTDRDNQRIQVFGPDGRFLAQWQDVGSVSTLCITDDQQIWAGGVLRNLDGSIVLSLPGTVGGHGTTVGPDGSVFVAQLSGVVQRFLPR